MHYTGPCSFDMGNGMCGWYPNSMGTFTWNLGGNQTATSNTGPRYDHTMGNAAGKYITLLTLDLNMITLWVTLRVNILQWCSE